MLRLIYCTSDNATIPMAVIFYMITDVLVGGLPQPILEFTTVMFHAYSRVGTSGENISGNMI